jgi:hypothetical protein
LLITITSLSGLSLLGFLGVRIRPGLAVFLGPPVTLAGWTIMLGIGVGVGIPIKNFYLVGWAATLGLAAYGCRRVALRAIRPDWRVVLAVLGAPIAAAEPYFRFGLTSYAGAPYLDGWSYAAFGQYVWEYPRQTEGGLAPLYQYAAHLSHIRYIGSALLAFLSPLLGQAGDPRTATGVVLVLALFVLGCASVLLAASYGLGPLGTSAVVVLTVFSGWSVGLISTNALDNSIALYTLPTLAAIIRMADLKRVGWWLLLALLVCAPLYTYPELAWLPLLVAGLLVVQRAAALRIHPRQMVAPAAAAAVVACAFLAPFATELVEFFRAQAGSVFEPGGLRPGEYLFHELTQPANFAWVFWGLTDQVWAPAPLEQAWFAVRAPLGIGLAGLAGLGVAALVRRRELATCMAIVAIVAAAALMDFRFSYAFGVFKILVTGWCLIVLCIALGGATLVRACQASGRSSWGRTAMAVIVGLYAGGVTTQLRAFGANVPTNTFETYGAVRAVASIVGSEPVLVAVTDEVANSWAVYELRDSPIVLDGYAGYMAKPHVIPFMEGAGVPSKGPIHYVLTDATPPANPVGLQPVWSQGAYRLWYAADDRWALINRVDAPNGLEQWGGALAFWLGSAAVDLQITAPRADQACLGAELSSGPSIPEQPVRSVDVSTVGGPIEQVQFASRQLEELPLSLVSGVTHVSLSALDQATVVPLPSGETRILLVGVENLQLGLGPCP